MLNLIRRLRRYLRVQKLSRWCSPDDHPNYVERVAEQRKRGSLIGKRCRLIGTIDVVNPQLVEIGDYCVIGKNSGVLAHGPTTISAKTILGDFVYVGFGAIILPGVKVGSYCIIGAGAVVTKDVPSGSVVAGNPARVLRKISNEEKNTLENTLLCDGVFRQQKAGE